MAVQPYPFTCLNMPEKRLLIAKAGWPPRTKKILSVLCALFAVVWIVGDPPVYFSKSIYGQIVDDSTGEPLPGVIVVGEWLAESSTFFGLGATTNVNTLETVSDERGRYEFAAWGPRIRTPGFALNNYDPRLTFFKNRYYTEVAVNQMRNPDNRSRAFVRTSMSNGKTVRLKPFDGNWYQYWNALDGGWSIFWGCAAECPRFVAGLIDESEFVSKHAPRHLKLFSRVQIEEFLQDVRTTIEGFRRNEM